MDEPRQVKYHESANKSNLIMGGDRELVLSSGLLAIILVALIQTWWSCAMGIGLWIVAVAVLKRMGKTDPMMRQVLIKHLQYRDFYPASSGVDRVALGQPKKW